MRSFLRILSSVLMGLSLVVCLSAAVMWGRSHWRGDSLIVYWDLSNTADTFGRHGDGPFRPNIALLDAHAGQLRLLLLQGGDSLHWRGEDPHVTWPAGQPRPNVPSYEADPWLGFRQTNLTHIRGRFGFEFLSGSTEGFYYYPLRGLTVPYWFLVLLAVPLPLRRLFHCIRDANRTRRGRCTTCNYDLRATPDRCPECGAEVAVSP